MEDYYFKNLLANSQDFILVIHEEDLIKHASQSWAEKLGYKPEQLVNEPFHAAFRFMGFAPRLEVDTLVTAHIAHHFEPRGVVIEFGVIGIQTTDGSTEKLLIGRDNTNSEVNYFQLKKQLQKEENLNQLKDNLLSMITHEIKNPLSTINSSADILKHLVDQKTDLAGVSKHIDKIQSQNHTIVEILGQIDLIKKQSAHIQENQNKQKLGLLVQQIKILFAEEIIVQLDAQLNECAVHKSIVEVILKNFISNALKYSGHQPKKPELNIYEQDKEMVFVVKDYGIGIPDYEQDKIFNPFFRGSNAKEIKGTGLGLNMTKYLAELIDGGVSFRSKEGSGSSFFLRVPCDY